MNNTLVGDRETEYLKFEYACPSKSGKTHMYTVRSVRHGFTLGIIRWHGAWRQYIFEPTRDTIFNRGCLADIQQFLNDLMKARR